MRLLWTFQPQNNNKVTKAHEQIISISFKIIITLKFHSMFKEFIDIVHLVCVFEDNMYLMT